MLVTLLRLVFSASGRMLVAAVAFARALARTRSALARTLVALAIQQQQQNEYLSKSTKHQTRRKKEEQRKKETKLKRRKQRKNTIKTTKKKAKTQRKNSYKATNKTTKERSLQNCNTKAPQRRTDLDNVVHVKVVVVEHRNAQRPLHRFVDAGQIFRSRRRCIVIVFVRFARRIDVVRRRQIRQRLGKVVVVVVLCGEKRREERKIR